MTPSTRAAIAVAVLVASAFSIPAAALESAALRCDGSDATIVGTSEQDHIEGTPGDDVIVSLEGDDKIWARGGDDVICAPAGADRIWGGSGDDRIFAGSMPGGSKGHPGDRVYPGPGNDYIDLGSDEPTRDGTFDNGRLVYTYVAHGVVADLSPGVGSVQAEGLDTVRVHGALGVIGTRFDDVLIGGPNGDLLLGGPGDDFIDGRGGNDRLFGDSWLPADFPDDDDVVDGGSGDDKINSFGGEDDIRGGLGRDRLNVTHPRATVQAGPGNDRVSASFDGVSGWYVDGGLGRDLIRLALEDYDTGAPGGTLNTRTGELRAQSWPAPGALLHFETFSLLDVHWTFYGSDASERILHAGQGRLRAWMGGGDDRVVGSYWNDYVDAGSGTDRVNGRHGKDTCLDAEATSRCEVLQEPGVSGTPRRAGRQGRRHYRHRHPPGLRHDTLCGGPSRALQGGG